MYRQRIRQPQYQQLNVEGHLRVCGNSEFRIFPLLQILSQDTNLRRSYETRFSKNSKQRAHNWTPRYGIGVEISITTLVFILDYF